MSSSIRRPQRGRLRPRNPIAEAAAVQVAEALERRVLMVFGPLTGEVLVNGTIDGIQGRPGAASDADGDYVIAWGGNGGLTTPTTDDDDTYGIYARRYNNAGVAQGGEFRVNTTTAGQQFEPVVAMDDDGDFVVAWRSVGQDPGGSTGVYARRYNNAGVAQGGEFRVNTRTTDTQAQPSAAMDADGDFVIAWTSLSQDGNSGGVYAKRYTAAGAELPRPEQALPGDGTAEFRVNTTTANGQQLPSVAMDDSGDFVIAWLSPGQDVPAEFNSGIYAQRFNAAGVPQGTETLVNTTIAGNQIDPSVAMDDDGDYVVAFESQVPGSGYDILAQRFNAAGAKQGGEFRANTHLPGNQIFVSAAMDADGDFTLAWSGSGGQDVPGESFNYGVYAQRYTAAGATLGGEFRVNTTLAGDQFNAALAMEDNGDFAIAWDSEGQDDPNDPSGYGVYSRRYGEGAGGGDTTAPRVAAVFVDGSAWQPAFRQFLQTAGMGSATFGFQVPGGAAQLDELPWSNVNRVHVRFSEDVIVDSADLAIRGVNTASYALNAAAFTYDAATFTATWVLANNVRFANDKVLLDLNADAGGVVDKAPAANRLDGEWTNGTSAFPSGDGAAGGDFRFQMNFLPGDVNRNGGVVNSIDVQQTRNRQFLSPSNPGTPPTTYTAFNDVDGSAFINSIDVQQVRIRQFSQLPAGNPTLVAAVPTTPPVSGHVRPADELAELK